MINKKLIKKAAAIAITGVLAVAMTATVMAGPGGPGGMQGGPGGGMQGGPGQEMQGSSTGERPEMPSGEEGIPRDSSDASKPDSKQMSPGHLESPDTEVGGRGEAPTGERPEMPSGEAPTGERPEMPSGEEGIPRDSSDVSKPDSKQMSPGHLESPDTEVGGRGEAPTGERPEMPGGKGGEQTGQMKDNKGMPGMNTDDIKTAVEALEDEDVKANLETLISEYETAKTALDAAIKEGSEDIDTYRETEMKAMEALRTALEEAGVETKSDIQKGGMKMHGFNVDDIKTAVEALEDEDVKDGLETLISDYETTKAALEEAVNDESEDIDIYREAEMKAMEALRTALEEAGIDTRPELPEGNENRDDQEGRQEMKQNGNMQSGQSQAFDNTEYQGQQFSDSNSSSDNIFERIGKWFMSLFSR